MRTLIVSSPRSPLHICVGFPSDSCVLFRIEHAETRVPYGSWRFEDVASVANHDFRILRVKANRMLFTDFVNFALRRGCSMEMIQEALRRALHIVHIEWEMLSRNPYLFTWEFDVPEFTWEEHEERRSGEAP